MGGPESGDFGSLWRHLRPFVGLRHAISGAEVHDHVTVPIRPIPGHDFGGIAFVFSFQRGSTFSNLAHLGGMIFGYVYIRMNFGGPPNPGGRTRIRLGLKRRWKEYKLQRAKKKFQVYMKKHDSDRGPGSINY